MTDFCLVHLEGICFPREEQIWVHTEAGDVSVQNCFGGLQGRTKLALHYWPPFGPDGCRWGYGSCLWETHKDTSQQCPAGHHQNPRWMLSFSEEGFLFRKGQDWWVGDKRIPLELLPGHWIRLVAVPLVDVDSSELSGLQAEVENIQSFLAKLRGVL